MPTLDDILATLEEFSPGFSASLVGCSPAEREEMASLYEQALPPEYDAFLERMGKSTGPLVLHGIHRQLSAGLEEVAACGGHWARRDEKRQREGGLVVIAVPVAGGCQDCGPAVFNGDTVVQRDGPKEEHVLAHSLSELIFLNG